MKMLPTPEMLCSRVFTSRSATSESCSRSVFSPESASHMNGRDVGLLLRDHRLVDVLRQPAAHAGHLVAHVLRGGLDVAVERGTRG